MSRKAEWQRQSTNDVARYTLFIYCSKWRRYVYRAVSGVKDCNRQHTERQKTDRDIQRQTKRESEEEKEDKLRQTDDRQTVFYAGTPLKKYGGVVGLLKTAFPGKALFSLFLSLTHTYKFSLSLARSLSLTCLSIACFDPRIRLGPNW